MQHSSWNYYSTVSSWLIDWVRLNVPPTHYRSYGDGFLRVKWPNQQCFRTEMTSSNVSSTVFANVSTTVQKWYLWLYIQTVTCMLKNLSPFYHCIKVQKRRFSGNFRKQRSCAIILRTDIEVEPITYQIFPHYYRDRETTVQVRSMAKEVGL